MIMKAEFMRLIVSNNTYKKLKDDIFDICDYIKLDEFQLRDIKRYVCAEYSVIHMENCVSIIYYVTSRYCREYLRRCGAECSRDLLKWS